MTDVEATTQAVQKTSEAPPPALMFPIPVPTEALIVKALAYAEGARADTQINADHCLSVDKMLLECESRLNAEHKAATEGMLASKKHIDGKKKEKMDVLGRARAHCKKLIGDFEMAQRLAKEEQDRLDNEALNEAVVMENEGHGDVAAGVLEEKVDLAEAAGTVQRTGPLRGSMGGSASVKIVWKFEIEEPAYVPRVFCEPSDALIRARLKEWEDLPDDSPERKIPGVRIYQDAKVTTR